MRLPNGMLFALRQSGAGVCSCRLAATELGIPMRALCLNVRRNMFRCLLLLAVGMMFAGTAEASQGGFTISISNEAVTQGELGSSSIVVSPIGGYTGNISFAATTSSPALTNGCVLFTNYANISGGSPATVGDLAVATRNWDCPPNSIGNQIGGSTVGEVRSAPSSKGLAVALSGVLLTGLLGLRSTKLRRLACLLVLITLGGFASGCSDPAPSYTPKGSYVLTVVGTDSGATPNITASTTFTVVVN
jgi:hypothetical protein